MAIKKAISHAHDAYVASGENGQTVRMSQDDELAKLLFGTESNIHDAGGEHIYLHQNESFLY